jgi:hypothetical protein
VDRNVSHQLLLAKEFYERACVDLRSHGPFSSGLAVSGLQDAVEMCLLAVAHELGIAGENRFFSELWGDIEAAAKRQGKHLTRRGQMNSVNDLRVQFKHRGLLPNRSEVERFRSNTQAFLEEAVTQFFGRDFSALTEIALLSEGRVRDQLAAAAEAVDAGNTQIALERCADALAAIREFIEPLYYSGLLVQFTNVAPEVRIEIQLQAQNLREQVARVRELALAALFGLNAFDIRMVEALLPIRRGDQFEWKDREIPVLPKNVRRCVVVLARYAMRAEEYVRSYQHPDWDAI